MNPQSWSVVITTRNRASMLRRAISSCVKQTAPCEIIVVDEASTDETSKIVKEFPGIVYIRNPQPLGHSASANVGIRAAKGEWIKPLDDDDWLTPSCIETMSAAIARGCAADLRPTLVSGRVLNVDDREKEIGRPLPLSPVAVGIRSSDLLRLMLWDQAPLGTPVQVGHSRDTALKVGGWNEHRAFAHQQGDEVEFWTKLAAEGDALFLPDLIGYRCIWWPNGRPQGGLWSREKVTHVDRFRSNLFLKEQIASHMGEPMPYGVKHYLALHWSLVAARDGHYGEAMQLGMKWIGDPSSIGRILARRSCKNALKAAVRI